MRLVEMNENRHHERFGQNWPARSRCLPVASWLAFHSEAKRSMKSSTSHLSLYLRQGLFALWHHQRISPGENRQRTIDTHLETANVILLFISADFLASEYCYSQEMKHALERHRRGEARVIPLLIRPVDWEKAPFADLSPLPTDAKPLTLWEDRDAALMHVATHQRRVIEDVSTSTDGTAQEICPYKGLLPYREEDAAFFFGREAPTRYATRLRTFS